MNGRGGARSRFGERGAGFEERDDEFGERHAEVGQSSDERNVAGDAEIGEWDDERGGAVVVPAIGTGSSLACVRSLGRRGVPVIAASESANAPAFVSKYCEETVRVPDPQTDLAGYSDALLSLAERPDVRTLVPLREPDVYVLAENRAAFAEHVAAPWPDFGTFEAVRDRCTLFERAAEVGVPAPETDLLSSWDDWDCDTVVKSRYTVLVRENGTNYPDVRFHPAGAGPDDATADEMGHDPIVQECVPGDDEYGFFALCDDGDPLVTFQHRRLRSYSYAGGASVFREAVDEPALARHGRRLLSALDWHGPAMVEFKRDPRTGEFQLLEVNPRFWGSLQLAVHAGVDFPYRYYQLACGTPVEESDYAVGVGSHVLRGELCYLASLLREDHDHVERPSLPRETARVLASLWQEPNFDIASLDDPRPFVRDVGTVVGDTAPQFGLPKRKVGKSLAGLFGR